MHEQPHLEHVARQRIDRALRGLDRRLDAGDEDDVITLLGPRSEGARMLEA